MKKVKGSTVSLCSSKNPRTFDAVYAISSKRFEETRQIKICPENVSAIEAGEDGITDIISDGIGRIHVKVPFKEIEKWVDVK